MSGIPVSEKHGVNPSLDCCFYCMEPKGVVLLGKMSRARAERAFGKEMSDRLHGADHDVEAPHKVVMDKEPCSTCKEHMQDGILIISVSEERTTDRDNPYRTGGWAVVTERFIHRVVVTPELRDDILKRRVAWLDDKVWDKLQLLRGSMEGVPGR
jgi:hypothetical protein